MKRGEATISTYLYGIIFFTMFIVGSIWLMAHFSESSPAMTNSTKYSAFNSSFNRYTELNASLGNLEDSLDVGDGLDITDIWNLLIGGAWQNLRLIGTSFGFMKDALLGLTTVFGVPAWIPLLLGGLITVLLIFAIWGAIFQRRL